MVHTVNNNVQLRDYLRRFLGRIKLRSLVDRIKNKLSVLLAHLLNKDVVLRLYVPIICLVLIFLFAVSRGLELSDDYSRIHEEAKENSYLIAANLTTQLNQIKEELDETEFRLRLASLLDESLPIK